VTLSTLAYRNPRYLVLFCLVLVALGVSAVFSLGRQEDPTFVNRFASVTTFFPGADPGRVEALVTIVLEDELRTLPEIKDLSSQSMTGVSVITIALQDRLSEAEVENTWAKVRDTVEDVKNDLPKAASSPEFEVLLGAYSYIVALTVSGTDSPVSFLSNYADELASRFRGIHGTRRVTVYGAPEEEVLVRIDPRSAAEIGFNADRISQAISAADSKIRAGQYRGSDLEMNISVQGEIRSLDRLRRIVLKRGEDGHIIQLGDIATITREIKSPPDEVASFGGRRAVLVAAKITDGLQIGAWLSGVQDQLRIFQQTAPSVLSASVVFDQSGYTQRRLRDVMQNMLIGVVLVIVVLLFTMGLREALIVAIILPLVALASMTTLQLFNVPIQQMSVTGLIVSLGLLVDAAIVMTDDIGRRLKGGENRRSAVQSAVTHLFAPLFASTLTTAFAFLPMLLLPGAVGDFLSSIAIAVISMVSWSFVLAVLVTPALAGWYLKAGGLESAPSARGRTSWLGEAFRKLVVLSLRFPAQSVLFSLALPILGYTAQPGLKEQFFPPVERDQFYIEVELQPGSRIERSLEIAGRIDSQLLATPGIEATAWTVGRSAPSFYYNMRSSREGTPEYAQGLVKTASPEVTDALLLGLQKDLSDKFPQARILVRQLVQGPPVDAPVELRVIGQETRTLSSLGNEIRQVLETLDEVTIVRATSEVGAAQLELEVDEAVAEQLGLDLTSIARQLETALNGAVGGTLVSGLRKTDVRVKLAGSDGETERIWQTQVIPANTSGTSRDGRFSGVPLLALAVPQLKPSERTIFRIDGERTNRIFAYVVPGTLPQPVSEEAMAKLTASGFKLPPGYRIEVGGDSDARQETIGYLRETFPIVMVLSAAVIVLTLNSFRLSLVVGAVAVLSVGLSLFALEVFGFPFGINGIIGVVGSVGIAVNAALIILSSLQENEAAKDGAVEPMAEVVCGSTRHIASTTVTTIGGFLPLILGGGGFWPPFAVAITGGVALSTIVSFFFVPPMYRLLKSQSDKAPLPEASREAGKAGARAALPAGKPKYKTSSRGGRRARRKGSKR